MFRIPVLYESGMLEEHTVLSIAFLLQIFFRHKAQRSRIDAVPQAIFTGTVVEHMTKMGIGSFAAYFRADHQVAEIGILLDRIVADRPGKAGPPAIGIEFIMGTEERLTGYDIYVYTVSMMIPEFVAERRFRSVVLRHFVLQRCQTFLQAVLILLMCPVILDKSIPAGALAVTLVVSGILVMITLVVLFGRVKRFSFYRIELQLAPRNVRWPVAQPWKLLPAGAAPPNG